MNVCNDNDILSERLYGLIKNFNLLNYFGRGICYTHDIHIHYSFRLPDTYSFSRVLTWSLIVWPSFCHSLPIILPHLPFIHRAYVPVSTGPRSPLNTPPFAPLSIFVFYSPFIVRGGKSIIRQSWEKIWDKLIPSLMCPYGSPVPPLSFLKLGMKCNMFISGWVWLSVIYRLQQKS